MNVRRALCAFALTGLAVAGCGRSTTDSSSGAPLGGTSASASASGSPAPGGAGGGGGTGASGTGGSGGGSVPKPGAPPECNEIAAAPGLHEVGDTLDKLDTPDTAAAASTQLHNDASQLTMIASHTGDSTMKNRLNAFAGALNAVAITGTDDMAAMMAFATTLRDVSQSAQDVCGLSIG